MAIVLAATPLLAGCAQRDDGTPPSGDTGDTGDGGDGGDTGDGGDGGDSGEQLTLVMGTMMPLTGALSNLGPGMQNGAKLAIEEINAAGKGLMIEVAGHEDDTTTDSTQATNAFNRLVGAGATAIAGPCCSGITGALLDLAVQNEVVISSPSATSPALTERENDVFFWRVAPTDEGQGRVLAELVNASNVTSVNVIAINNDYGSGLANIFAEHFRDTLGGTVGTISKYDEGATEYSSQVTEACTGAGSTVEGVVLVAYTDEAAAILRAMNTQGCLSQVEVFASEGVYNPGDPATSFVGKAGKDDADKYLAAGVRGTTPQAPGQTWTDKYNAKYGAAPDQYAAESYDAVMYVALAALHAGSTEGRAIGESLRAIADGGEKCSTFADCADLIAAGTDIDYVGMAHDLEYTEKHEPASGAYALWTVGEDGRMTVEQENVTPQA